MATLTYQCTVCNRQIELTENQQGLTTFNKCIITNGCKGKLNKIKRNPDNNRGSFPVEVIGLEDYVQRKAFYPYTKTLASNIWPINHNMGISPAVDVYVYDINNNLKYLDISNYTIKVIDKDNINIVFNNGYSYSGKAQLLARNSAKTEPKTIQTTANQIQITSNGTFVFAIPKYLTKFYYPPSLKPTPTLPYDLNNVPIRIEIMATEPNSEAVLCTEILSTSLYNTPWNDWNEILVRKRKNCYLFTKNIADFKTFSNQNSTSISIPSGTQLKITRIDYGTGVLEPIDPEGLFILLANSPYSSVDRILNQVVDVSNMVDNINPYFTFNGSDFTVTQDNIDTIYPPIVNIKTINYVGPSPTPTVTPSLTPTITPTPTISITPSIGPSITPTTSVTVTPSITPSITISPSITPSISITPTITVTPYVYSYLERLNENGSVDTTFADPSLNNSINIAKIVNGYLYVSGEFTSIGGNTFNRFARFNLDGTVDTTYSNGPSITTAYETAYDIIDTGTYLYVGGNFTSNGYTNLMRLNLDGSVDTTFTDLALTSTNEIYKMLYVNNYIYVVGNFINYNGYSYVMRLNADGTLDTTFTNPFSSYNITSASSYLRDIILGSDNNIYIVGTLSDTSNGTFLVIARFNNSGIFDTTYLNTINNDLNPTSAFNALSSIVPYRIYQVADSSYYVVGNINSSSNLTITGDFMLNLASDGSLNRSFTSPFTQVSTEYVSDIIQVPSGNIYVVGTWVSFLFEFTNTGAYVGKLAGIANPNGNCITYDSVNNKIYIGGL